jgi:hypothetical protein
VINHYGDEVLKVYGVGPAAAQYTVRLLGYAGVNMPFN